MLPRSDQLDIFLHAEFQGLAADRNADERSARRDFLRHGHSPPHTAVLIRNDATRFRKFIGKRHDAVRKVHCRAHSHPRQQHFLNCRVPFPRAESAAFLKADSNRGHSMRHPDIHRALRRHDVRRLSPQEIRSLISGHRPVQRRSLILADSQGKSIHIFDVSVWVVGIYVRVSVPVLPIYVPAPGPATVGGRILMPHIVSPVSSTFQVPRLFIFIINDIHPDSVPVCESSVAHPRLIDLRDFSGKRNRDLLRSRAVRSIQPFRCAGCKNYRQHNGNKRTKKVRSEPH